MSKIIYDVIQRFEVENGVPRLVSTNIQVIEGGEDLLSLAISLLTKLGFYEKFEEKRTSQYIGYKLKNPGKGAKRYQLVLSQRQDSLYSSIPKDVLKSEILNLVYLIEDQKILDEEIRNYILSYQQEEYIVSYQQKKYLPIFFPRETETSSYSILYQDKLFPYMSQVRIISSEVLEQFINHFAKILMEKN